MRELCSQALAAEHPHLIEPANRKLICACDACAILFSGGAETKYRRVPRRIRFLADFQLTDALWESLEAELVTDVYPLTKLARASQAIESSTVNAGTEML